jgi:hypothetical protein
MADISDAVVVQVRFPLKLLTGVERMPIIVAAKMRKPGTGLSYPAVELF